MNPAVNTDSIAPRHPPLYPRPSRPEASPGAPVKFISSEYFSGRNAYHSSSVLRRGVDCGVLAGAGSAALGRAFAQQFVERFTALRSLIPNNGLKDEFIARLRSPQGVGFEELLLEAVLAVDTSICFAMHNLHAIAYAGIEKHGSRAYLSWSCESSRLSRQASEVALTGVMELLPGNRFGYVPDPQQDFAAAFQKLQHLAQGRRLSPTTAVLKLAAQKRGLPCEVLGRQHLMLGQGQAQQQLYASMTSTTPITAQKICADKRLTNRRLTELRLPVPRQYKVRSLEEALAAAAKLGFPIVVKPLKGSQGSGVSAGLRDPGAIPAAFARAQESGDSVLVERFEPGRDHRLLVIGGQFTAALIRRPPSVIGDGRSSVEQLIDQLNADPWRDGFRLFPVEKDSELLRLLQQAGLGLDTVLEVGREFVLRATANVSTGGLPIDITDQVHPDNRDMAERAARGVGLDVAGIDFLTTDISRSYREVGGVITELNARPGLCMHTWPKQGQPRNVAGKVLELFYPPGDLGRVPLVSIAGDKGTGTVARILDRVLRGAGRSVALSLRKHAYINGLPAELSDLQQKRAPQFLLRDPQVGTLVATVSPRQVTKRGLLFDTCKVAVLMHKTQDADALLFYQGLDIIERATSDCFVVGVGDSVALNRLKNLGGRRLILVGERLNDPAMQEHMNAGHTVVSTLWLDGKIRIVVFSGTELQASFSMMTRDPRDGRSKNRRLKNGKMYAIAAACGLGLEGAELRRAFKNAPDIIPEELN